VNVYGCVYNQFFDVNHLGISLLKVLTFYMYSVDILTADILACRTLRRTQRSYPIPLKFC